MMRLSQFQIAMEIKTKMKIKMRKAWDILCLAFKKFFQIDGSRWACAFAFNAFFSLFPLMILFVTIASYFIDRERAGKEVLASMESYVPISGKMKLYVFDTIAEVINVRKQASIVALLILVWSASQCFTTLISAINRAWGTEIYNWWQLPLAGLMLLGTTVGIVMLGLVISIYAIGSFFIPLLVLFLSLLLFYKLAPLRTTNFAEVFLPSLFATILFLASEAIFVVYLENFATLNAIYGAFGGIMALLLWIYLVGCIFIFGACLCAAPLAMENRDE